MGMITQEAYFRQRVFELCGKARSHSRSDPVPHEPKNGSQVEKNGTMGQRKAYRICRVRPIIFHASRQPLN